MHDTDMWLSTPEIKRPVRISLQQKLTGEVSNGDIARTNFAGDYDGVIEKEEEIKDKGKAWVLDLKATRKDVTYAAIKYWVLKSNFMPIKSEFYTADGKLLKKAVYALPQIVMGDSRITTVVIHDAIVPSNESIMKMTEHKKENLSDSFFNKDQFAQ